MQVQARFVDGEVAMGPDSTLVRMQLSSHSNLRAAIRPFEYTI